MDPINGRGLDRRACKQGTRRATLDGSRYWGDRFNVTLTLGYLVANQGHGIIIPFGLCDWFFLCER